MRQKCCGKPLDYNKESDVYSCLNCGGHINGHVARASEDPLTPAPEVLDNIASLAGASRRGNETDAELRARIKGEENLTNGVLRTMLADRDRTLARKDAEIKSLKEQLDASRKHAGKLSDVAAGIPD